MKKLIVIAIVIMAIAAPAFAADNNGKDLGIGLYLGSPVGITAKYDLDDQLAVVGGLGFGGGLMLNGGIQYNFVDFSIEELDFNVYFGGNVYVAFGTAFDLGIQVPIGICYYLKDPALELFLEVGPSLGFVSFNAGAVGGIGARYELDM